MYTHRDVPQRHGGWFLLLQTVVQYDTIILSLYAFELHNKNKFELRNKNKEAHTPKEISQSHTMRSRFLGGLLRFVLYYYYCLYGP